MSQARAVTVIIPNLNSPIVDRTIASLGAQTQADAIGEILVIGRDDPGRLARVVGARLIETPRPVTAPVARNLGIGQAQGDLLAFIDADCIADRAWLEHLLSEVDAGHPVVSGAMEFPRDNYWAAAYNVSLFHEFLRSTPRGPRGHLPTSNLIVQRSVIDVVGPMDEELARGQDTDWTVRMLEQGVPLWFTPHAWVLHDHSRRSVTSMWRQCAQSGAYSALIRQRHASTLAAPSLLRRPVLLLVLAPFIAGAITARIFLRDRALWREVALSPAVYLTKIAWCVGAAAAARTPDQYRLLAEAR